MFNTIGEREGGGGEGVIMSTVERVQFGEGLS